MALLGNSLLRGVATSVAVGVALTVVAPVVMPAVVRGLRPVSKGAVKFGVVTVERARETIAELAEVVEDVFAEAEAEIEQERAATGPEAAAAE